MNYPKTSLDVALWLLDVCSSRHLLLCISDSRLDAYSLWLYPVTYELLNQVQLFDSVLNFEQGLEVARKETHWVEIFGNHRVLHLFPHDFSLFLFFAFVSDPDSHLIRLFQSLQVVLLISALEWNWLCLQISSCFYYSITRSQQQPFFLPLPLAHPFFLFTDLPIGFLLEVRQTIRQTHPLR